MAPPAFRERLAAGLRFDGAAGILLRRQGWPAGRPAPLAALEAPHLVRAAHEAYRAAGADVLTAEPFGPHGGPEIEDDAPADALCAAAIGLARAVAGPTGVVAVSIGPPVTRTGPLAEGSFRETVRAYRRRLAACRRAAADLVVLDGFADLLDLQAALTAARAEALGPLAVSVTPRAERLAAGLFSPEAAVALAEAFGADLVGVNCLPPAETVALVGRLVARARVPVLARPSAADADDGSMAPAAFTGWAARLAALGARHLGGCCGTTPAHVAALASIAP